MNVCTCEYVQEKKNVYRNEKRGKVSDWRSVIAKQSTCTVWKENENKAATCKGRRVLWSSLIQLCEGGELTTSVQSCPLLLCVFRLRSGAPSRKRLTTVTCG